MASDSSSHSFHRSNERFVLAAGSSSSTIGVWNKTGRHHVNCCTSSCTKKGESSLPSLRSKLVPINQSQTKLSCRQTYPSQRTFVPHYERQSIITMASQEFEYHRKPKKAEDDHWAHDFMFSNVDSHFIETLQQRIPKEIGCALAASLLVSPLVGIIDKCIVQEISGAPKFMTAVGIASREMLFAPKTFYGSLAFRLTFGVYFGTYAIANLSEAFMDAQKVKGYHERKEIKVVAASAANVSLLSWRDAVFARQFTTPGLAAPTTPLRTLGLFAARDVGTMYATFYLAPRVADYLKKEHGVEKNAAELSTALGIPMLAQFVTAPMHIHAMHYYQAPKATFAEHMQVIQHEFWTVSVARGLRILPAFGLASFSNNKFRELFIRQANENKLLTKRITRFLEDKKPLNPRLTKRITRFLDDQTPRAPN